VLAPQDDGESVFMWRYVQSAFLSFALLALAPQPSARAAEKVDLLLVLSSDVSRSVTADKFKLQRDGYAAAIANPKVLEAIKGGRHGRIAVMFSEWSGAGNQRVIIDWTVIDGPQTAHAFGTRLLEEPRAFADRTSISGGIDHAIAELAKAPFFSERQTIDVSGDGTNNSGRDVRQARDEAVTKGIVVNGLVILSERPMPWNPEHTHPPGGLTKYYRDNVTGGPGSFVMEAQDYGSFGDAILKKMIAEIADASQPGPRETVAR
jgi:hypothetical protein